MPICLYGCMGGSRLFGSMAICLYACIAVWLPGCTLQTFKLSNFQTFKLSNFQTFKLSNFQTFKLSNFEYDQTFKLSNFEMFKLSNFQKFVDFPIIYVQTFKLSNFQTLRSLNFASLRYSTPSPSTPPQTGLLFPRKGARDISSAFRVKGPVWHVISVLQWTSQTWMHILAENCGRARSASTLEGTLSRESFPTRSSSQ